MRRLAGRLARAERLAEATPGGNPPIYCETELAELLTLTGRRTDPGTLEAAKAELYDDAGSEVRRAWLASGRRWPALLLGEDDFDL